MFWEDARIDPLGDEVMIVSDQTFQLITLNRQHHLIYMQVLVVHLSCGTAIFKSLDGLTLWYRALLNWINKFLRK